MTIYATNLLELGEALRHGREAMGVSVEQAAKDLRIRHIYLTAIENGQWEALPGQAYGRGYLRQYAGYLGYDVNEVMALCDQLQGKIATKLTYFDAVTTEQAPSRGFVWFCLIVAAMLLAGWWWVEQHENASAVLDFDIPQHVEQQEKSVVFPAEAARCLRLMRQPVEPCYYPAPVVEAVPSVVALSWQDVLLYQNQSRL